MCHVVASAAFRKFLLSIVTCDTRVELCAIIKDYIFGERGLHCKYTDDICCFVFDLAYFRFGQCAISVL